MLPSQHLWVFFFSCQLSNLSPWKGNFPSISCAAAQSVIENALQQFSYFSQLVVVHDTPSHRNSNLVVSIVHQTSFSVLLSHVLLQQSAALGPRKEHTVSFSDSNNVASRVQNGWIYPLTLCLVPCICEGGLFDIPEG